MTRFLAISLMLVLCNSCALKTTEGLRSTTITTTEVVNPYFSSSAIDYVYKAKIEIYGKNFGGVLIIKKVADDAHRVVFTTEFGSKVFDFLYKGDTFVKNFVIEDLDKKIIVNTLRKDFKLLVSEKAAVLEQYASEGNQIYKTKYENRYNFYFFKAEDAVLEKIIQTSKTKEKVEIVFISEEELAKQITINHANIKLKIDLDYFNRD